MGHIQQSRLRERAGELSMNQKYETQQERKNIAYKGIVSKTNRKMQWAEDSKIVS